ncbi:MAG: FAD-dependent oxidoreductase [Dehalococcoidia bacterium]|nr:FAD-dependent oxidoreductase [Dehalococcoidia bacterium]
MTEKFDAIVVGAGPAGTTAALVMARAGMKVALIERGAYPGAKNMFGGVFYYSEVLNQLIPEFWKEAPIERHIVRRVTTFMTPQASVSMDYENSNFGKPPYNGVTLLRSRFDRWYAQKAVDAGALLVPETVVDDVIRDGQRVIGIKARRDQGDLLADVVIAADGVNSLLAEKAGLKKSKELRRHSISVTAKEILSLPSETIEERFNCAADEGVAIDFLGACTQGIQGAAFIYTNKSSLSLGMATDLNSLREHHISIADLVESFKEHPSVKRLVKGATLKEYSGHLMPEGGYKMMPKLYGDGILVAGDAAAMVFYTGLSLEGVNFAIASGFYAGEAVKAAKAKSDFSAASLSHYQKLLEDSFVLKDLKSFRSASSMLANKRFYTVYPDFLCTMMENMFKVDGKPRKRMWGLMRQSMKGKISMMDLAKDGMQARKALL